MAQQGRQVTLAQPGLLAALAQQARQEQVQLDLQERQGRLAHQEVDQLAQQVLLEALVRLAQQAPQVVPVPLVQQAHLAQLGLLVQLALLAAQDLLAQQEHLGLLALQDLRVILDLLARLAQLVLPGLLEIGRAHV